MQIKSLGGISLGAYFYVRYYLTCSEPAFYQMASGINPVIEYDSGTEFSKAVNGRNPSEIIPVFDELMTTLQVLHPRLYDGVLNKL